ncbi:LIM/homeobox protein Lhx2-like [Cydia pomonella]|uniref:LIM/homeobox protein Lhx2-like n=1 Tax=Cydia pomonella TaxID=82600 RepID=UPI002ADE6D6E|nr:LIM/homeobox protein Lhx2-like [Cydia pomonella]
MKSYFAVNQNPDAKDLKQLAQKTGLSKRVLKVYLYTYRHTESQRYKSEKDTSFKHYQLRGMKSYFAVNQNPDAKNLKQLAQKTGLSKRVLKVYLYTHRHIESEKSVRVRQTPTSSNTRHTESERCKSGTDTSFKHHQLRGMKSYFAVNQNPLQRI